MKFLFDLGGVFFDWDPNHFFKDIFDKIDERNYFLTEICNDEWNIQQDYKNMNRSKSKFNNAIRDYTGDDPREVAKLYIESLQDQYKNAQLIKGKLNAYRDLGFELDDMYKALTKSGIKGKKSAMMRSLINIDNNTFMPHSISKDMMLLAEEETKVPVPYETLQKIYKMYSGLSLEKEEE